MRCGSRTGSGDVGIYSHYDNGAMVVLVNQSPVDNCNITVTMKDSHGVVSTRETLITKDVVPPKSLQLLNIVTPVGTTWQIQTKYKWVCGNMQEKHDPGIFSQGLHDPIKLSRIM